MSNKFPVGTRFENKYGEYFVTKIIDKENSEIRFTLSGSVRIVCSRTLRGNNAKDYYQPCVFGVGYLGEMQGKTRQHLKSYKTWTSMLSRCYSEKSLSKWAPTYRDISVCKEWHNFTNFNRWFEGNYIEGFDLDKDLISKESKIYSPQTCKFISRTHNSLLASKMEDRFLVSPEGHYLIVTNLAEFGRKNTMSYGMLHDICKGKRKSYRGWVSWKDKTAHEVLLDWKDKYTNISKEESFKILRSIKEAFTQRGMVWAS